MIPFSIQKWLEQTVLKGIFQASTAATGVRNFKTTIFEAKIDTYMLQRSKPENIQKTGKDCWHKIVVIGDTKMSQVTTLLKFLKANDCKLNSS